MMKKTSVAAAFLVLGLISAGCEPETPDTPPMPIPEVNAEQGPTAADVDYRWLEGSEAEMIQALESQLGGFSQAMIEVGQRYQDLHWAGVDRNWGYADYQLEHIVEAMEKGIIRRPGRAANSMPFLEETVPVLEAAIEAEDGEAFDEAFERFTAHCNSCHLQEEVGFIYVIPPEVRLTAVTAPPQ